MNTDREIQKAFRWRSQNLPWYPRHGRRGHLDALFGKLGFKTGAEIGTRQGDHALQLCKSIPDLKLYCIDPWLHYDGYENRPQAQFDAFYAEAQEKLAPYDVTLLRGTSLQHVHSFPDNSLDFVHLDGNHTFDYTVLDLVFWVPKVRFGGIVSLHDCELVYTDVLQAVLAYTTSHHIDPWYITRETNATAFWVRKEEHGTYSVR